MLFKRLMFIVVSLNIVWVGCGRAVQDENARLDFSDDVVKIEGQKCAENRKKESVDVNKENKSKDGCPYGRKELCLILSLSKIAKVQVAVPNYNSGSMIFSGFRKDLQNLEDRKESQEHGRSRYQDTSKNLKDQSNVPCRAIRDVYIPEVSKKMPAFACKFQNRTFILSSPRFLQDRRSYLDVNVDANVFANARTGAKVSRSSELNVIPALLVLKGTDGYRIRTYQNVPDGQKIDNDKGN